MTPLDACKDRMLILHGVCNKVRGDVEGEVDVQAAAKNWLDLRRAVTGHLIRPGGTPEKRS